MAGVSLTAVTAGIFEKSVSVMEAARKCGLCATVGWVDEWVDITLIL
jgi:hypothetical protein